MTTEVKQISKLREYPFYREADCTGLMFLIGQFSLGHTLKAGNNVQFYISGQNEAKKNTKKTPPKNPTNQTSTN